MELDDISYARIKPLCARGDKFAEGKLYEDALKSYWEAWDLLLEPKQQWDASTWILAAIGDANYLSGDYESGRDNLSNAMHCPDAIGNPLLHMRLGQCQFELGNLDRSADELMRAYMGAGKDIFESEDKKYLNFLATKAQGIEIPKKRSWNPFRRDT